MDISRFLFAVAVLTALWFLSSIPQVSAAEDDALRAVLREGDQLLIQGRKSYPAALAKYTQAVAMKPTDAKVVFRRAELYFMMKEWHSALTDLEIVLKSDPSHRKGLETRAKIRSSMGFLVEAANDFEGIALAYSHQGNHKKVQTFQEQANLARELGTQWEDVKGALQNRNVNEAQWRHTNRHCVDVLSRIITHFVKDNTELRLQRVECALAVHDHQAVSSELKNVQQREAHNLRAIELSARAFRVLGALDQARADVRRCLALDPEFAPCAKLHKTMKVYQKATEAVDKALAEKDWKSAIQHIDHCLQLERDPPNLDQLYRWRCQTYKELRDPENGLSACTHAIDFETNGGHGNKSPRLVEVYLWRADLNILADNLAGAEEDLKEATECDSNNKDINEFRQKLENIKKRASIKDYYKILNVPKTADEKEIRKSFRTLSRELHPDTLRGVDMTEAEREKVEARYRDILEAKEILMDADKRQRYDNGEDVANPQSQQQQQHHGPGGMHFHFQGGPGGGGGPFGGGGFNFHF